MYPILTIEGDKPGNLDARTKSRMVVPRNATVKVRKHVFVVSI